MAMIPQKQLFSWEEIENLGDLQRLELVLKYLPDEPLMRSLESHRGRGRNDYPIRAVWNSILAGVVFQHHSIESLRRELFRNGQLRGLCGFDVSQAAAAVPPAHAYSRFLKLLLRSIDGDAGPPYVWRAGHGLGPSERQAEGQDQKPCAGRLIPAERDPGVLNSVCLCVTSIGLSKSGLIEPIYGCLKLRERQPWQSHLDSVCEFEKKCVQRK